MPSNSRRTSSERLQPDTTPRLPQHAAPELGRGQPADGVLPLAGSSTVYDDEVIDLRLLFRALWRARVLIVAFAALGACYGVNRLLTTPGAYEATMVVLPRTSEVSADVGRGLAGQLLSGLTGTRDTNPFDEFTLTVSSVALAQLLEDKHGFLRQIFPWDAGRGEWVRPSGLPFEAGQTLRSMLGLRTWQPPTVETLAEFLDSHIRVDEIKGTDFQRISFRDQQAPFALEFLTAAFTETDNLIRERMRTEAELKRGFLEDQLAGETSLEARNLVFALIAKEIQNLTIAEGAIPYSARIIDPAFVSSQLRRPSLPLTLGAGIVGGAMLAVVLVSLIAVFRHESNARLPA